ncbi:AraC family transcriptional regulator [Flavobacterium sp. GSA192]|uniref:AraC family transcriptional regulator n=1 Tax=Flavobacterium sp. GSA192 TaxID=2576304 RepID=UPI0011271B68|nr:AraC family transcriptional regulator [Flavobacterium sp. GSA192]
MKAEYRSISPSLGSSFNTTLFEGKEFIASWHFHPQYELTYILGSSGIRYVGDNMGNFEYGDLVLVGSNLPHCWKTIGEQKEEVRCIIVQWDEEMLEDWLEKKEFQHIKQLLALASRGIRFDFETALKVESKLLNLIDLPPFERLLSFLQILQELAVNGSHHFLAGEGFTTNLTIKESERVNLIYNYVKEYYNQQISLDDVSKKIAMNKESFCRFFKKTFRKSFFEFINEYKISMATKMLINTDLTASEIGYEVGYNNLSFFNRQFNKFVKMSPSKYRKMYRDI